MPETPDKPPEPTREFPVTVVVGKTTVVVTLTLKASAVVADVQTAVTTTPDAHAK